MARPFQPDKPIGQKIGPRQAHVCSYRVRRFEHNQSGVLAAEHLVSVSTSPVSDQLRQMKSIFAPGGRSILSAADTWNHIRQATDIIESSQNEKQAFGCPGHFCMSEVG